jgi:hypothetical protein
MVFGKVRRTSTGFLLALLFLPSLVLAQTPSPSLRGQVLDPSGAAVPAITVEVAGPAGTKLVAQTDEQGKYAFAIWRRATTLSPFA